MTYKKMLLAGLTAAVLFSTTNSAFAWGCYARGYHGVYGYSYSYGNRSDAIVRALEECSARGSGCRVVSCDRYK